MKNCETIMKLIKELVGKNPNDADLGKKIRILINNKK